MAFTYDPTDLNTDTPDGRLNVLRYLIGDTDREDPLLDDGEIAFSLSQNGDNVYQSASACAMSLGARFAREVDTKLDGALSETKSQLSQQFYKLAKQLAYQATKSGATLGTTSGGITLGNISYNRSNPNRQPSSFYMGQFDNPNRDEVGDV